ncbi:hypothetical protein Acr_13g0006030 [Actinidia rufa]|uniref:Uncharacterized protein n=1 Tax=Actinidia rufa TaxID=165716 RepID=A0A7J0FKH7_9ERIC|nr:hypothetical protein Acr_13g0006030 [Actinidia rufa]
MLVSNGVCTKLRRRGPPSLLYSDSLSGVPALASCHSAINVGATRPKLVRLRARPSSCTEILRLPLGLTWYGHCCHVRVSSRPYRAVIIAGGETGPHPGSYLANPLGRALISNQSNAEEGDGMLPSHLYEEFNDKFKIYSDTYKEAIRAANNRQESRDIEVLLVYESYYRHRIPHKTVEFVRGSLPPLRIEGYAPQSEAFSPEVSELEEGYTMSSLDRDSLDLIGGEDKEEEATGQLVLKRRGRVVLLAPALDLEGPSSLVVVSSSNSKDDLVCALRLFICGTEVAETSFSEADIIRFRNLKRAASTAIPPPKVILPATHALPPIARPSVEVAMAVTGADPGSPGAYEPWDTTRNLLVMQHVQARDASYEAIVQAQGKAATTEATLAELQLATCGPVYEQVFTWGINRTGDNYNRQVVEVHSKFFWEVWLSCLKELGVPKDNPAWARAAPAPEFLESPVPYSPLILPSFNGEEF